MEFVDFAKKFHPKVWAEYVRSQESWDSLQPGDIVLTLRPGFSGGYGAFRRVGYCIIDSQWEYKELTYLNNKDRKSLLMKKDVRHGIEEHWWQSVVKVDYDKIQAMDRKDRLKLINDIVDGKVVR